MTGIADVPKFDAPMMPIVERLRALGGSAANDELYDKLSGEVAKAPPCRNLTWACRKAGIPNPLECRPSGCRGRGPPSGRRRLRCKCSRRCGIASF